MGKSQFFDFHPILWGSFGLFVGIGLTKWIQSSINGHLSSNSNNNYYSLSIFAFSAIRIFIVGALMFFAFSQGFYSGLAFLGAFMISRWVWLYRIINNQQGKG